MTRRARLRLAALALLFAVSLLLAWRVLPRFGGVHGEASVIQASIPVSSPVQNQKDLPNVPLRSLAAQRNIHIGAAVQMEPFRSDATYRALLAKEFNNLIPENVMKFGHIQSERDRYDFVDADALVAFAQQHQMQVHGTALVWYRNLPKWLTDRPWTREELLLILRQHIYTVVSRFRGQVNSWDVVNESVSPDGESLRSSIWLEGIGPEYIGLAFRWAHEADPAARLFYNDYRGEGLGKKSDRIYQLLKELKQDNIPIHGVGLQMHVGIDEPPNFAELKTNMQRLNDLGLEVKITEMDVQIMDGIGSQADKLAAQASIYRNVLRVCLQVPNCTGLSTWGVADPFSWIRLVNHRPDSPLLFDDSYRRKPAYSAMQQILKSAD
ncbi:MAG: endo-1,4-beta-xylanase [Kovacikia sp.]